MKDEVQKLLVSVLEQLGLPIKGVVVSRQENSAFGEYTTTAAMSLAKDLKQNPRAIAQQIADAVNSRKGQYVSAKVHQSAHQIDQKGHDGRSESAVKNAHFFIEKAEVAGPGFINFHISKAHLINRAFTLLNSDEVVVKAQSGDSTSLENIKKSTKKGPQPQNQEKNDKKLGTSNLELESSRRRRVMVEFAHPNTHKAFHIGHLRNITTGETIVRLLESQGVEVIRANYQGDVGMHIAKALYGLQLSSFSDALSEPNLTLNEKVALLGKAYAAGSQAFESDEVAKAAIVKINKQIYAKDPSVIDLYTKTRQWSLDYFDSIYARVDSHFDKFYFESQTFESGKKIVLESVKKGIFEESDGAVIFDGEKYGLHKRVFITSEGNPTYEGKDMGLAELQFKENPDKIVHVVGPEQAEYFKVVFKAVELLWPQSKGREEHLVYGFVKLKEGKMSSRTGQVVLGEWLLDEAKKEVFQIMDSGQLRYPESERESIAEKVAVAAVKYAFLRVGTKQEIAFSFKESVTLHGDSGPYLLYTYARCKSVLRKAQENSKFEIRDSKLGSNYISTISKILQTSDFELQTEERELLRLLMFFPEVVAQAANEYAPNALCTYLFKLAQGFNAFYAKHSILSMQNAVGSMQQDKVIATANSELQTVNFRLALTSAAAQTLKRGLYLLGIQTVEEM